MVACYEGGVSISFLIGWSDLYITSFTYIELYGVITTRWDSIVHKLTNLEKKDCNRLKPCILSTRILLSFSECLQHIPLLIEYLGFFCFFLIKLQMVV